ncbi:MAG: hypothetical protein ACU0CO_12010 [Shimia sp.]
MNDNVENMVLMQAREMRDELKAMDRKLDAVAEELSDLTTGQRSIEGMLFGLAGYVRGIDERVEHIEEKLGADT